MERDLLINSLGLAPAATDEEITAEINRLKANQAEVPPAEEPAVDPADGDDDPVTAKLNSLEQRLQERDERDAAQAVEALVNQAITDRKILPAQKTTFMNAAKADFEGTRTELDGMPAGVVTPGKLRVNTGSAAPGSESRFANSVNPTMLEHVTKQQAAR